MVSKCKRITQIFAPIASIGVKAEEDALQTAAKVDANGVEVGGPSCRRLGTGITSVSPIEEEYLLVQHTGEIETEEEGEARLQAVKAERVEAEKEVEEAREKVEEKYATFQEAYEVYLNTSPNSDEKKEADKVLKESTATYVNALDEFKESKAALEQFF